MERGWGFMLLFARRYKPGFSTGPARLNILAGHDRSFVVPNWGRILCQLAMKDRNKQVLRIELR